MPRAARLRRGTSSWRRGWSGRRPGGGGGSGGGRGWGSGRRPPSLPSFLSFLPSSACSCLLRPFLLAWNQLTKTLHCHCHSGEGGERRNQMGGTHRQREFSRKVCKKRVFLGSASGRQTRKLHFYRKKSFFSISQSKLWVSNNPIPFHCQLGKSWEGEFRVTFFNRFQDILILKY